MAEGPRVYLGKQVAVELTRIVKVVNNLAWQGSGPDDVRGIAMSDLFRRK